MPSALGFLFVTTCPVPLDGTTKPMSEEQPKKKSIFSELSVPQILAGALSAITVAFALSKLGVSGTLIGAGIGSILGTFGTTLYARSLDKSTVLVKKVAAKPVAAVAAKKSSTDSETSVLPSGENNPDGEDGEEDKQEKPDIHDTQEIPVVPPSFATRTENGEEISIKTLDEDVIRTPWYRRINWKATLVLAGVSLALAMAILSLYEVKTGSTLSGEEGTTIQRVIVYRDAPAEPTPEPTIIYLPSEEPEDEEVKNSYPLSNEEQQEGDRGEEGGTSNNTGDNNQPPANQDDSGKESQNGKTGGRQEERPDNRQPNPVAPRPTPEPKPSPEPKPQPQEPEPVEPEPEDPAPVDPPPASNPVPEPPGNGTSPTLPDPGTGKNDKNIQLGG